MNQFLMLDRASILLVTNGTIGSSVNELLLEHAEITRISTSELLPDLTGYNCVALAVDRPYPQVADTVDVACHKAGIPWCGAALIAHVAEIGPMVVPGQTPCYMCWKRRRAAQAEDPDLAYLIDRIGQGSVGRWFAGELPAFNRQAAALLVFEVLQLAERRDSPPPMTMGDFWQLDALTGESKRHIFASVGYCSRCRSVKEASELRHHLRLSEVL